MSIINKLNIIVSTEKLTIFFQLLEQGFILEAPAGCSLREFIQGKLGLDPEYLAKSVQTIFLDHHPVDNLDTARIQGDSTVALSAAMPGLAGATLRTGGRFAAMRNQISYGAGTAGPSGPSANVTVKFFNQIAKDLGKNRLKTGVRIQGSNFTWFVDRYIERLKVHIRSVQFDGETIDFHRLASIPWQGELFLQVFAG